MSNPRLELTPGRDGYCQAEANVLPGAAQPLYVRLHAIMSNVVFILGAGASKQAGAPLMANFLDVSTDLLRANRVGESKVHFERVFTAIGGLQAVHSKAQLDLNNIESIFTALELGRIIQRVPGMASEAIAETIGSLKELIVKTLETTIPFPTRKSWIGVPKPYEAFGELIKYLATEAFPTQTSSILTFNYDVAADMALFRAGLGPNYVIESSPHTNSAVDLLKLHGSLNWATETEGRRIRPLHLHHYFQKYSIMGFEESGEITMPIGSQLREYFGRHAQPPVQVEAEPVIVPPSWNKADYHHALSNVWAAAARHLSEAEHIFIAGYSLPETDSFFRHLFALGSVGKAALRRLVVFNPDQAVDSRFRSLLGPGALARYEFHPLTFEESINFVRKSFPKRK
jgi:hypothetical protein